MRRSVVISPAQTERSRQQAFLNVVPDRAPGDAAEISEIADGVKDRVAHESEYRQLLSHCQLSLFCGRTSDFQLGSWGVGTSDQR